jgi:signal transduction histidine kinase
LSGVDDTPVGPPGRGPVTEPDPLARTIVPLTASGQYTRTTATSDGPRRSRRGLTVRAKLALIFVALFLVFGTLLTAVTYFLVRWRLYHPRADLPNLCRLTEAQRQAGTKLTALQQLDCAAAERADTLQQILIAAALGLVVIGLLVFAVGYWVAARVLRPLSRVTATARRIARRGDGTLDARARLAPEGPRDELYELAETFDEMLDRLDAAFESQRRFTGNASHELRTPLAVSRTLLEVALADPDTTPDTVVLAQGLLATNERSERMIEGLLALSKADQAVIAPAPVRWNDVVGGVVALSGAEAAQRGLQLRTQLNPVLVRGDGPLLEQVATNLVHNAIRHNVPDGTGFAGTGRLGGRGHLRPGRVRAARGRQQWPVRAPGGRGVALRALPAAAGRGGRAAARRSRRGPRPVHRALGGPGARGAHRRAGAARGRAGRARLDPCGIRRPLIGLTDRARLVDPAQLAGEPLAVLDVVGDRRLDHVRGHRVQTDLRGHSKGHGTRRDLGARGDDRPGPHEGPGPHQDPV